jgi:hypothetical protein
MVLQSIERSNVSKKAVNSFSLRFKRYRQLNLPISHRHLNYRPEFTICMAAAAKTVRIGAEAMN